MAPSCERCGVNSLSARRQEGVRARERRRRECHKPRKAIEVKKTQALIEDVAPEHIKVKQDGLAGPETRKAIKVAVREGDQGAGSRPL